MSETTGQLVKVCDGQEEWHLDKYVQMNAIGERQGGRMGRNLAMLPCKSQVELARLKHNDLTRHLLR